jgi:hypothetical protein
VKSFSFASATTASNQNLGECKRAPSLFAFPPSNVNHVDGRWLHDGQSFIFSGNEPGRGARLYLHRSDAAKPISPEGANAF